jgi:hypothetical protein
MGYCRSLLAASIGGFLAFAIGFEETRNFNLILLFNQVSLDSDHRIKTNEVDQIKPELYAFSTTWFAIKSSETLWQLK